MRLKRDNTGKLIWPAKCKRTLSADFLQAVPSWISTTGTQTHATLPSAPLLRVTTGAVSGNTADITGPALTLSAFRAVVLRAEGLRFSAGNSGFDCGISLSSTNNGVGVQQEGATLATYWDDETSAKTEFNYQFRGGSDAGDQYRNIELVFIPSSTAPKEFYLFENGGMELFGSNFNIGVGSVTPRLWVKTTTAAAKIMEVQKFEIDLWL